MLTAKSQILTSSASSASYLAMKKPTIPLENEITHADIVSLNENPNVFVFPSNFTSSTLSNDFIARVITQ